MSVEKRKKVLFARFDSLISSAAKSKAWEDVAREISGVGGGRTAPETKKKWCQVEFCINIFILVFHIGQVKFLSFFLSFFLFYFFLGGDGPPSPLK